MDKRLYILPLAISISILVADGFSIHEMQSETYQANLLAQVDNSPGGDQDTDTPILTDVSPKTGEIGTQVTLAGSNFANDSHVLFNNETISSETLNAFSIQFIVPVDSIPGQYNVEVQNADGKKSNMLVFVIPIPATATPDPTPTSLNQITVTKVEPSSAAAGSRVIITTDGTCLADNNANWVEFGSNIYPTTKISNTELQFTVPDDLFEDVYQIKVGNDDCVSNTIEFIIIVQSAPQEHECHRIFTAADFPQTNQYARPYDLLFDPGNLLMKVKCGSDDKFTAEFGTADSQTLVHQSGYVYRDNIWSPISYVRQNSSEPMLEQNWIPGIATSTFAVPTGQIEQESFVLAFICQAHEGRWKCGCTDATCAESKWNVQVFRRTG